ncbi:MAG: Ppx/GppA phosphatase family protein [Aeromicrobium sp.]|uniref:Ppx/GppA phosphatase family protein n=1 Tax=Aeromicrobium sp. TaxID=1871063 RepID=UPI0039E53F56
MTRVAAVDCGTNSIRLLVSDIDGDRKTDLVREMRIVRLGEGVDETGRLATGAIERTVAATREYAEAIAGLDVERIAFCATSAARDAENAEEFAAAVEAVLGVRPVVLDGVEEARRSFLGAARDLELSGSALVTDIGGGSTEVIVGEGEEVASAVSLDIGSVRLTERFLATDPPTAAEVAATAALVDEALWPVVEQAGPVEAVVGVAGTVTTVAAHALGLPAYDSTAIHGAVIDAGRVREACADLVGMRVAERRTLGFMHPGRADVIGGGAVILDRLLDLLGASSLTVSERDILDGIAWAAAGQP